MFSNTFKLALIFLLTLAGCGSDSSTDTPISQINTGINLTAPLRIRESLAVDETQVTGKVNVNGQEYAMTRSGSSFRAAIEIPANSDAQISLTFTERLPNGRQLTLARTNPINVSVGASNQNRQILQEEYVYDFDDDNDGISNILERENGTDPFAANVVVLPTSNRSVEVRFFLPQVINDPFITQSRALIADQPEPIDRSSPSIRIVTAEVSTDVDFLVDIRLSQRYNGQSVLIARAAINQPAGEGAVLLTLSDSDFDFSLDSDNDGVTNLAEMQAGTNPFQA